MSQQSLFPSEISFWVYCLWSLLDPDPILSEAGHLGMLVLNVSECLWCRPMSGAQPLATCLKLHVIQRLWLHTGRNKLHLFPTPMPPKWICLRFFPNLGRAESDMSGASRAQSLDMQGAREGVSVLSFLFLKNQLKLINIPKRHILVWQTLLLFNGLHEFSIPCAHK